MRVGNGQRTTEKLRFRSRRVNNSQASSRFDRNLSRVSVTILRTYRGGSAVDAPDFARSQSSIAGGLEKYLCCR